MSFETLPASSMRSCILSNGQAFIWKNSEEISPEQMDRRIVLLSTNPPTIIAQNQSPETMVGEMTCVPPLCGRVIFSPERDKENRATIFFFEVLGKQFKPAQQLLDIEGTDFNRYCIHPAKAEFVSTELRFLLRRIMSQFPETLSDPIYRNLITSIVELDFDGYHLKFLPEEVGFFENIRILRLTNCDLKRLPASIGQLTELTELHLGGNALNTLPDSILNCSKLFAIRGLYHQLPYSKLIQFANAFFEKENIAVAVNLIQQAFQAGPEQSDLFSSDYSAAIALLKKIVNSPHLEAQDYRDLSFHVIEAIDKISDKSEKFSAFRAILQEVGSSQKNFDENPELAQQILNFQNRLTASCVELAAALPESSSPYMALRQLTETLFSINSFSEGLKVAQQLIDFSNSRPNYNRWTMIVDMKGSELQSTSNMLRKLSSDLVKKDKKLAFKVANSIPLADIRSVALSDLGKDS